MHADFEGVRTAVARELELLMCKKEVRREAEAAWSIEKGSWVSERTRFKQERGRWAATAVARSEERLEKERAVWE
jgi:hypothetical protein